MYKYGFGGVDVKSIAAVGGIAVALLAIASPGQAAQGEVDLYEVTIKKVELCTDVYCTDSSVISSDETDIDIASASAGAEAGALVSDSKPTIGKTYNYVGITMSRTFQVRGVSRNSDCVTTGNGAIGTKANGEDSVNAGGSGASNIDGASTITEYIHSSAVYGADVGQEANWSDLVNASALTWVGGSETTAADARIVYALSAPYTATEASPTITVTINTQNTIYDTTGNCTDGTGAGNQATLHIVDPAVTISVE